MPAKKKTAKPAAQRAPAAKTGDQRQSRKPEPKEVRPRHPIEKGGEAPELEAPRPTPLAEQARERYWMAVGRRKTAVARVRLFTRGEKGLWVNEKPVAAYFATSHLQRIAEEGLGAMKSSDRFHAIAKVSGGGLHAQAEAIRHGTARALVLFNPDFRKRLKREGFLTRDPRVKERKKFGLKGARRAPQWAKR